MVVWIRGDGLHKEARRWAAEHVRRLEERYGITPKLAVLLLNDDPVELETQKRYVSLKAKDVREVGGEVEVYELYKEPPEIREAVALKLIERLNNADDVTGIIIQKPLPPYINEAKLFERLNPMKDVDGLTPENKNASWRASTSTETYCPARPPASWSCLGNTALTCGGPT